MNHFCLWCSEVNYWQEQIHKFKTGYLLIWQKYLSTWTSIKYFGHQVQLSTKYFWISKGQVQVSTKCSIIRIKYQVPSTSTLPDPNPGRVRTPGLAGISELGLNSYPCGNFLTSGKLLDLYRNRGPVATWKIPSFTGPPKLLQDLNFFNIRVPIEGLPTGIFITGQEDRHGKGFYRSSTVFTGQGLGTGGLPIVCGNNWSFPETRERARVPVKKIGSWDSIIGLGK